MEQERQARALALQVETGAPSDDEALAQRLRAFLKEAPRGRSSVEVRLLLARVLLRQGQAREANREAMAVLQSRALLPRHRDTAQLIQAETLLGSRQEEQALAILLPLQGQLFEMSEKRACARDILEASLLAGKYELVLPSLLERLRVERFSAERAKELIDQSLARIPATSLAPLEAPLVSAPSDQELVELLTVRLESRLTDLAIAQNDAELAREVLRRKPSWLRGTTDYEALIKMTLLLEDEARVIGHRVGIVLGGATTIERSRSIEVMAGVDSSLRHQEKIAILSEEDSGSVSEALSRLTAEGASILVAGYGSESALEALRFAEERHVPVLAVAPPESVPPLQFGFRAGPSEESAQSALAHYASELKLATPSVASEENCGLSAAHFVGPLIVMAGRECLGLLSTNESASPLFLGLDVSGQAAFPGRVTYYLRSHLFPSRVELRSGPRGDSAAREHRPERFYEKLGEDLGALILAALRSMPEGDFADRKAVLEHYSAVRERLLAARAPLATTQEQGFTAENSLSQTLGVQRFSAGTKQR